MNLTELLKYNGREFSTKEELDVFVQQEQEFHSNFGTLGKNKNRSSFKALKEILERMHNDESIQQQKDNLIQAIQSLGPSIHSYDEKGLLVRAIESSEGLDAAKGAYFLLSGNIEDSITNFSNNKFAITSGNVQGIIKAAALTSKENTINLATFKILEEVLQASSQEKHKIQESIKELNLKVEETISNLNKKQEEFDVKQEISIKEAEQSFISIKENGLKEISSLKKTYEELLKLKQSYTYWDERIKQSRWTITIAIACGLAICLIFPFIFEYLLGVSLPTLAKNITDPITTNPGPVMSSTTNYGNYIVFTFTIFFIYYLVSLLTKIVVNQLNIINDCRDRIVKSKYFIAVSNETESGKLDPKDRTIFLKSVFEKQPPIIGDASAKDVHPVTQVMNVDK